jgi:hypothetical protein
MLADNSAHLRAAARSKHDATRRRALAALDKLETDGKHATVTALANAAGVARSWIYTQADLIDRINAAPQRPRKVPTDSHDRRILAAPARTGPPTTQRRLRRRTQQTPTLLAGRHGHPTNVIVAIVRFGEHAGHGLAVVRP